MKKITLVAVIQDRTLKVSSDGTEAGTVFTGNEEDVKKASAVAKRGLYVALGTGRPGGVEPIKAGFDSSIGLAAAMASVAPQYVYFWRAPEEVMNIMQSRQSGDLKTRGIS